MFIPPEEMHGALFIPQSIPKEEVEEVEEVQRQYPELKIDFFEIFDFENW